MKRFHLAGVALDAEGFESAVNLVLSRAEPGRARSAHFCNVHLFMEAYDHAAFREELAAATYNATDGMPLALAARRHHPRAERVSGPDLMRAVLDRGRQTHARHFFYGGGDGVAELLAERLRNELPGIEIAGTMSPAFGVPVDEMVERDTSAIAAARPDYVWVGIGAPRQDQWVEWARERVPGAWLLAVGAAFDFHSGTRRRAPVWMRRAGLEWLFRLMSEPRRLWRRYLTTNSRFLLLMARLAIGPRERTTSVRD